MEDNKFYFERVYRKKKFEFEEDSKIINKILNLKEKGSVLDLGCGEAGNAIFLAEKGFNITLLDISKAAIKKIGKEIGNRKIEAELICEDLNNFKINKVFDIIMAVAVFHFLEKEKTIELIKEIKKKTNKEGINVIVGFLEDTPKELRSSFKKGELKRIYSDWKIVEYKEYKEKDKEGINSLVRLIAVKK
jgi:cyclopropane fatty-acyl-phospholipid synthase-like methyltransferase